MIDNWGVVFWADEVGNAVEDREGLGLLVVVFWEDDIDERVEVEKKVEDGGEVVVEDGRNGMTTAGFEATDGVDVGGPTTEE